MVYAAARRGRPELFPDTALPAFAGGCVWAIAMVCWFVANADLSEVIAFVSSGRLVQTQRYDLYYSSIYV